MPELKLEITEGLDQELKKLADAKLVTKEDMANAILANCIVSQKQKEEAKTNFFGLDLAVVGQAVTVVGQQLMAMAQKKKE